MQGIGFTEVTEELGIGIITLSLTICWQQLTAMPASSVSRPEMKIWRQVPPWDSGALYGPLTYRDACFLRGNRSSQGATIFVPRNIESIGEHRRAPKSIISNRTLRYWLQQNPPGAMMPCHISHPGLLQTVNA